MTESIVTTKTPKVVDDLIDSLGAVLSGDQPDTHGIRECFWSAFAHSLATDVHRAFLIKSSLGTDELGQKWPDLDPKTKAYSRPEGRAGLTLHKGKPTRQGNVYRPTLSPEQDKVWRQVYATRLAFLRTQMSEAQASSTAAGAAWEKVKAMGATTILAYAKDRTILLLQRSGALARSLQPGPLTNGKYTPPADQVFTIDKGGLTWGSGIEYASRVAEKRPFWPPSIDPWISRAVEAGIEAIVTSIKKAL